MVQVDADRIVFPRHRAFARDCARNGHGPPAVDRLRAWIADKVVRISNGSFDGARASWARDGAIPWMEAVTPPSTQCPISASHNRGDTIADLARGRIPNLAGRGQLAENAIQIPNPMWFSEQPGMEMQAKVGGKRPALFVQLVKGVAGTVHIHRRWKPSVPHQLHVVPLRLIGN